MDENAYNSLRTGAAYFDLTGRGNIRVTGEDRVRLLHAMTTNHIEQLLPGTGCYAFFLTAQGRILADVNLFCMPDHLLLDTEPETKDRVRDHLEKFIIADDVTLEDFTPCAAVIAVEGPQAEERLKRIDAPVAHSPYAAAEWGRCVVAHTSYTGGPGYAVFTTPEDKPGVISRLENVGVGPADLSTAEVVRLEHGRPRYGSDFSEANIPQETQLMHAIHPSKGCYLGQEIVERVRSRGHVNRRLTGLEIDSHTAPGKGDKVQAGGKDAGEITSAAFSPALGHVVALAMLRTEAAESALTVNGASAKIRKA